MRSRRMAAAACRAISRSRTQWAAMRTLRFADGPDEVHNRAIARDEFGKYGDWKAERPAR